MAPPPAVAWDDGRLRVLDQRRLPHAEEVLELRSAADAVDAIRSLAVRGAPLLGVVGAYALTVELAAARDPAAALGDAARRLAGARPTAVNLPRAVERVAAAARRSLAAGGDAVAAARAEAEALHAEEEAASAAIAARGATVLAGRRRLLTHCNTGALAAPGHGTALAVVAELWRRGALDEVVVPETRPLLQGARLTAWELRGLGIPHRVVVDGAAAGLVRRGEVDGAVVGCDRVAGNGDVANKVGTYAHALACRAAGVPFVVAGPTSTIDPEVPHGDLVEIEERDEDEVRAVGGVTLTPEGTRCRNPAFDVTPAELVTALVTERGTASPVTPVTVSGLVAAGA